MAGKPRDISNQRFGRLLALYRTGAKYRGDSIWLCQCDCGNQTSVRISQLNNGHTKSCGCLHRDIASQIGFTKRTHGHNRPGQRTPTYYAWLDMKKRCTNPKASYYADYGGRGIIVCERWLHDFASFLADLGEHPGRGYSLERLDVNGNYEPSNCTWATATTQARNRRNNRLITYNGETKCMAEWAEGIGLSTQALWLRIDRGWPLERALTEKPRP